MPRNKKIPRYDLGISEYEMESLTRILLPILQEYLASDEGKRDWQEWQSRKEEGATDTENKEATKEIELDDIKPKGDA